MKPAYPANRTKRRVSAFACRLVLVFAAAALSGCYSSKLAASKNPPPPPDDYRLRHPISIQERARTIVVFTGSRRGGLTPAQRADVLSFALAWKREAAGGVVVETPVGTPNERASAETLREIQSILSAAGLPPGGVQVRSYRPGSPGELAAVRLAYPRMTADAGPCGLWPEDLGPTYRGSYVENRPHYNFGCSTQRNLAAMVDNPADLIQPRGETPAYSGRRVIALDKYRKGESSATTYPNMDAGKVSDVAK